MPERLLQAHPASSRDGVAGIEVAAAILPNGALSLSYVLSGDLAVLRIPASEPAARADGLWRHTCFEAFIRAEDSAAYREFNFSPAGLWQAYAFTDYRAGGLLEPAAAPEIACRIEPARLTLHATIPPEDLPPGARLQVGLTAVVEHSDGSIGYWALQHAAGQPDFHHPETFALELIP